MNLRLLLLTGLFGLAPTAFDPPQEEGPLAQLSSDIRELHGLRARKRELIDAQRPEAEAREETIRRLEAELARVSEQLETARAARAESSARLDVLRGAKSAVVDALQRCEEVARPFCDRLTSAIEAGVTFRRDDRASQVRDLRAALDSPGALERLRPLTEIWTLLGEELRLSRTIDERPETVRLQVEGRPLEVHAYVLRLGLVQELFVSEDSAYAGSFDPTSGVLNAAPSEASGASIRQVMGIARGRIETQLAPAPVTGAKKQS
jgi:hypothetical protein